MIAHYGPANDTKEPILERKHLSGDRLALKKQFLRASIVEIEENAISSKCS